MNNTRSFANNPRVVKEENPNRARMKKKTPARKGLVRTPILNRLLILTKAILEATNRVGDVMVKQPTEY